jgi:hypothetical protein
MPQYMLLLYDDPSGWAKLSPEEVQAATQKYMNWTKKPFVVQSKRLGLDAGKVMRGTRGGQSRTTDGPYSETKEVLGGFYLIEAADYNEAVTLSKDHPQLEYGGTIELRELYKM